MCLVALNVSWLLEFDDFAHYDGAHDKFTDLLYISKVSSRTNDIDKYGTLSLKLDLVRCGNLLQVPHEGDTHYQ